MKNQNTEEDFRRIIENSLIGAVAIFEYSDKGLFIVDSNQGFLDFFKNFELITDFFRHNILLSVTAKEKEGLKNYLLKLMKDGGESEFKLVWKEDDENQILPVVMRAREIGNKEDKHYFLAGFRDDSESARIIKRIENNIEGMRLIVDNLQTGFAFYEINNGIKIHYANDLCYQCVGYNVEEIQGIDVVSLIFAPDKKKVIDKLWSPIRSGQRAECDFRVIRKSGDIGWINMRISPLSWEGREGMFRIVSLIDITESKKEAVMQQTEISVNALKAFFEEFYVFNFKQKTVTVIITNFGEQYVGKSYDMEQAKALWLTKMIHSDDLDKINDMLIRAQKSVDEFNAEDSLYCEYRVELEGKHKWVATSMFYRGGGIYLICNKDITKMKNSEILDAQNVILKIRQREQDRYGLLLQSTNTVVVEWNFEERRFYCDNNYSDYLISDVDQFSLYSGEGDFYQFVHPDDVKAIYNFLINRTNGAIVSVKVRLMTRKRVYVWCRMSRVDYTDERTGVVIRSIGAICNVEREEQAILNERKMSMTVSNLIDNIPSGVGIYKWEEKWIPIFISTKMCQIFGFSKEEYDKRIARGQEVNFVPDVSLNDEWIKSNMKDGEKFCKDIMGKRKDGSEVRIRANGVYKKVSNKLNLYLVVDEIID